MYVNQQILEEMFNEFKNNLLSKWYPLVIDSKFGGYYSNISYNWKVKDEQDKMIVTQARHIWTSSKANDIFEDNIFLEYANHGFKFLKNSIWDKEFGGFYQIRNCEGNISKTENWLDEKRVYGNAFAIYGLAALYNSSKNTDALNLAIKTFDWINKHAYDPINKGYFQFLTREGEPFGKNSDYKTSATDGIEAGYKDQNSSIHLLEAFTELYTVWNNPKLKTLLTEMLLLIRDTITTPKGYLNLFFKDDWSHISFTNRPNEEQKNNFGLDHVSFGHDYETAFLMLEASYTLGIKNDKQTLITCKKMLDHAIENGWDSKKGGFFDEGYYFIDDNKCKIIKRTKTWWIQAEGLNALLLFSKIFPDNKLYIDLFEKLWNYVKTNLIDEKHKGWYWGSLEKEPFMKRENKGSIWKGNYHNGRALINCIAMLSEPDNYPIETKGFIDKVNETNNFIDHWKKIAATK